MNTLLTIGSVVDGDTTPKYGAVTGCDTLQDGCPTRPQPEPVQFRLPVVSFVFVNS